jgi:cell division protein FtsQ
MSKKALTHLGARNWPSLVLVFAIGVLFTVTTVLIFLAAKISDPSVLPINKVVVSGNFEHLQKTELRSIVHNGLGGRGFFRVNVNEIQGLLMEQPWIEEAVVRRVWKDTLLINIKEQVAVAVWGGRAFLNKDGEIFRPEKSVKISGLVRFTGPEGLEQVMLEHFGLIAKKLSATSIVIDEVILTDRGSWTLITSGGKELIFGKQFLSQRLERFLRGYYMDLSARWASVRRIDLRYSNGLAIATDRLL